MGNNQTFDRFKRKLTVEALLNSALLSLGVGFAVAGLVALICWLCGYKEGIWVALGVGAGSALIFFPLVYFLKFRPSAVETARRVDALGLQERAVTMLEFMNDESHVAVRQRDDAQRAISSASSTALKTVIPAWIGIFVAIAFAFGTTFGVVGGLFRYEVLKSPVGTPDPMEQFVAVTYLVEDGGEIQGEADQLLLPGENATTVTAIAVDGYMFIGWDDGVKNPSRTDLKITEDLEITAMFESIDEGMDPEEGDFDGPANDGDSANDQPADGSGSEVDGSQGDGQGNRGDGQGTGSGDQEGEGKGDGQGEGAGGQLSESNKIVDGEVYYRDWLEQYKEEAMNTISALDDLPPEIRAFIEAYYESI